jgi:hypothetical protein
MLFKKLLAITLAAIIGSSCASTEILHLSVLQPAPVSLPSYIKNVAVVNRTSVAKKSKVYDAIDKVVTLEGSKTDQDAAEETITGLADELKKNTRFEEIKLVKESGLTTNSPGMFPAPLSWDVVEKYCDDNNADALFALELFDTDSKIDYSVYKTSIKTPFGAIPSIEQQANMHTLVKAGWRIYDLRDKEILDEAAVARTLNYYGRGMNPLLAAQALINRKEAVKEVGNAAGHAYAFRIIPLWIRVSRNYYVRGTNNFKLAKRKARTGNWDAAAQLWEEETHNPKRKVAGRACYNMAIINEINGHIEEAINWAQRSYENYNIHQALYYVNVLKNRQVGDDIAQAQQQEAAQ